MMLVEQRRRAGAVSSQTHDNVGLAFDTGHAFVAGVDIPRVLDKYGHRIRHLHLKDVRPQVLGRLYRENLSFNEAVRAGLFTIPGDGCIDYAPILDFARDSDYRGWLIIEAEQDPAMAPLLAHRPPRLRPAGAPFRPLHHQRSTHHERAVKYWSHRLRFYGQCARRRLPSRGHVLSRSAEAPHLYALADQDQALAERHAVKLGRRRLTVTGANW